MLLVENAGMRHIRIKRGLHLALPGEPMQTVRSGHSLHRLRIDFTAYPGLQADVLVSVGERVRGGAPLACDHRQPTIVFPAPADARVAGIERDARRRLVAVSLDDVGEGSVACAPLQGVDGQVATREAIVQALLRAGLWPLLRERPFDLTPSPKHRPVHLFVTAMDSRVLSPDAASVISGAREAFDAGVRLLARLATHTHVCQAPGSALLATHDDAGIDCIAFDGPHPSGLVGTHIATVLPGGLTEPAWYIDYQDVITIGTWLLSGQVQDRVVVALGGPDVFEPHLVATRRGGYIEDILFGARILGSRPSVVLIGDPCAGRRGTALGAFDRQLSVWPDEQHASAGSTVAAMPANEGGDHAVTGPVLPGAPWHRVSPLPLPLVALLRALCAGDADAALRYGALTLGEDDMALFSCICPSRNRYGPLLAAVHARWREQRA